PFYYAGSKNQHNVAVYIEDSFEECDLPEGWNRILADRYITNIEYGVTNPDLEHVVSENIEYEIIDGQVYVHEKCSCGGDKYAIVENAVIATPSTAQAVLDSNINGKIVVFDGEFTEDLHFRPTRASNSIIMANYGSNADNNIGPTEYEKLPNTGFYYYQREIKDVKFVSTEGTVLKGLLNFDSRWYNETSIDPMRTVSSPVTGTHTSILKLENLEFNGLEFEGAKGRIYIRFTSDQAKADNIVVDGCKFVTETTAEGTTSEGATLYIYRPDVVGEISNIVYKNNYVDGHKMGIYVTNANNISVIGNTVENTLHNAFGVQSANGYMSGEITIEGNTISQDRSLSEHTTDRAIRFGTINNATVIIRNNTITNFVNSVDGKNEVIKTGNFDGNSTLVFENNKYYTAEGIEYNLTMPKLEGVTYYICELPEEAKTNHILEDELEYEYKDGVLYSREVCSCGYKHEFTTAEYAVVNGVKAEIIEGKEEFIITGLEDTTIENLIIPDVIAGLPVTEIGVDAFESNQNLKSLVIGNSIKTIKDYAFYNCDNIETITIGSGLEVLGEQVFAHSTGTKYLTIDQNNQTYYSENNALITKADKVLVVGTIAATDIPEGVTKIGDKAYYGTFRTENYYTITIPASVTEIGILAFNRCAGIEKLVFAEGSKLTKIGTQAFFRNGDTSVDPISKLTELILPETVVEIGNKAFSNNQLLAKVSMPGVKVIGEMAFSSCIALNDLTLSDSLEEIKAQAFVNCTGLKQDIVLPETLTVLGKKSFFNTGITSVHIPSEIIAIGDDTFYDCKNLITVSFAEGCKLQTIGNNAFRGSGIESFTCPETLMSIGECAFYNCASMIEFSINSNLETMGNSAFAYTKMETVYIEENNVLEEIPYQAFHFATNLTTIDFTQLKALKTIGTQAFTKTLLEVVILPESMVEIGDKAFGACASLKVVILNTGLETIGKGAFGSEMPQSSSLVAVWIPDTVGYIGSYVDGESTDMFEYPFWRNPNMTIYTNADVDAKIAEEAWPSNFNFVSGNSAYPTKAQVIECEYEDFLVYLEDAGIEI
ncbi:MAG: leucine-rich repeat protein, partial [Clostridia bacterium]|nr:leucine-rich repeat protein [Clostridia bacterium]